MDIPVFERPHSLLDVPMHYCPGCTHGIIHRLICEVIDEMNIEGDTIGICPVGCSVTAYDYFACDMIEAPHGRAPAVATGVKRAKPDKCVFTYSGDGDFASIGLAESMHAALRGEKITAICINNTTYGMTGGQLGPTTLLGQVTTTSPTGRNVPYYGYPIKIAEHIAMCDGTAYSARVSLDSVPNIRKAKQAIRKAFEVQEKGLGFGFVEILSSCPTNWRMTPEKAHDRVKNEMMEVFKPGVYKDLTENNN